MRLLLTWFVLAVCAGCGAQEPGTSAAATAETAATTPSAPTTAPASAPTRRIAFVGAPIVRLIGPASDSLLVAVRVDRALPQGDNGVRAGLFVPQTYGDIPGFEPMEGTRRCYVEQLYTERRFRAGERVSVRLDVRGRDAQSVVAEAVVRGRAKRASAMEARVLGAQLGCPRRTPERECDDQVHGPGLSVSVTSAGSGATCATARRVMSAVARWVDDRSCERDLCASKHRMNAEFRCTVAKVGEIDWTITCRRGKQVVRGYTGG